MGFYRVAQIIAASATIGTVAAAISGPTYYRPILNFITPKKPTPELTSLQNKDPKKTESERISGDTPEIGAHHNASACSCPKIESSEDSVTLFSRIVGPTFSSKNENSSMNAHSDPNPSAAFNSVEMGSPPPPSKNKNSNPGVIPIAPPTLESGTLVADNGIERGGGDLIVTRFKELALAFVTDLIVLHEKGKFLEIQEDKISAVLPAYRINSTNSPIYDQYGVARDAITDRKKMEILLYGPRWISGVLSRQQVAAIVIHELLRAADAEYFKLDDKYVLTLQFIQELLLLRSNSVMMNSNSYAFEEMLLLEFLPKPTKIVCKGPEGVSLKIGQSASGVMLTLTDPNELLETVVRSGRLTNQVQFGSFSSSVTMKIPFELLQPHIKRAKSGPSAFSQVNLFTPHQDSKHLAGSLTIVFTGDPKEPTVKTYDLKCESK